MKKELGKIRSVYFGRGGYQDAMLGLWMSFEGKHFGVGGGIQGWWDYDIPPPKVTKADSEGKSMSPSWSESSRSDAMVDMLFKISKVLRDAKVDDISKLKGMPVELTFDGEGASARLINWRILTEVL